MFDDDDRGCAAAGDDGVHHGWQTHQPDSPFGVGGTTPPDDPADVDSSRISQASAQPVEPSKSDTPKVKKDPLRQLLRGPIGTEVKRPRLIRHSGERPLHKVAEALAGLKPKPHKLRATADPADKTGHEAQARGLTGV